MQKQPLGDTARHRVSDAIATRHSPINDPARLAALKRTGLICSPAGRSFDRLTRLASLLLHAPVALVSLVDDKRQFFKSHVGLPEPWATRRETPLSHSFCRHVVENGGPLIINDASTHELVRDNPAVKELRIGAYAGIPLQTADGHVFGSFCVIDHQPRVWKPGEIGLLSEMAASVMTEIALETKILEHQTLLERFSQWCERMPIACFTCGPDMHIVDWNQEASHIFGHAAHTVVGRTPHELLFAQEHRVEAEKSFFAVANRAIFNREGAECTASDGRTVLTDWTFTPLLHPGGEPGGFVAMVQDVTARHRAEKERVALEGKLIQRQKLETLGMLASGMAHDLGNFLGVIAGNTELALRKTGPDHPAAEALDEIYIASQRARDLVQQNLGIVRNRPANPKLLPLQPIVEESAKLARTLLGPSVNLVATCAENIPNVLADATQVERAILNLVTNARHSLGDQPGTITIALDAVIDAPGAPAGPCARIAVRDTGKGMDAATLERIFEPFFSTKTDGEGTGLGLPIVRGIMNAHRGTVVASSEPGRGSEFSLFFPGAPDEQSASLPEPAVSSRGRGQRIWLLDDDESVVFLTTRALKSAGYEVRGFTDTDAAMLAFRANPDDFALALVDSKMPRLSGIEVAAQLRAVRPQLPIILASGSIPDELRHAATQTGIRHVLEKTNSIGELEAVVHAALHEPQPI